MKFLPRLLLLLTAVATLSCSDSGGSPSPSDLGADLGATVDAGETPDAGLLPDQPDVSVAPVGARARVLESAEDGIGGRAAMGVAGDVLLENDHVRFVVRTQARGLVGPAGGNVIDADVQRPAGEPGNDRLLELFPMIGFARVLQPGEFTIVDDGAESGTAILRTEGVDVGVPLIDSFLPTQPQGVHVTLDYILTGHAQHLELRLQVTTDSTTNRRIPIGAVAQFGDSVRAAHHRCGDDVDCLLGRGDIDWLAAGGGGVSYGLTSPADGELQVMLARERILLVQAEDLLVPAGEMAEARMFLMVGWGSVAEISEQAWRLREAPERGLLSVTLQSDGGSEGWGSAWIEARDADSGDPIAAATPDDAGYALMTLPPGRYELHARRPGSPDVTDGPFEITAGVEESRNLTLAPTGRLHAVVHDAAGEPLDALLLLQQGHGAPDAQGARFELLVTGGEGDFTVLPGDYTVVATHGYTYGLDRSDLTITGGATAELELSLEELIETPGALFLDTHDHCEYSIDSDVLAEDRVRNALAVGVDVLSTTDHDTFRSLQPVVESLGVADRLRALPGNEISPLWGHQVGIGCPAPEDYATYYDVPFAVYDDDGQPLRATTPTEIWRSAREDFACELLILAHPWCSQAAFEYLDFLPGDDPDDLLPDADLSLLHGVELLNSHDEWDEIFTQNLPGWFNLLDHGRHLTAVGGSDEHGLGAALGHPRNLVQVGTDDVASLDEAVLYEAVRGMHNQVVAGPILHVEVGGAAPGETVVAGGDTVSLHLDVRAAPWVPVDYVRVYINGVLALEPPLDDSEAVLRLSLDETLAFARDSYVVVVAGAEGQRMGVAGDGRPSISASNPVFVDLEGDGYRAPRAGLSFPPQVSGPPPAFYDCRAGYVPQTPTTTVPTDCVIDNHCTLPMVMAHRGAGGDAGIIAPENSLAAIRAALYMGVDGVELDVRHTADDELILMHDSTVDRTTTGSGTVSEMTLAELQALRFRTDDFPHGDFSCEGPPTLAQAFELTRGRLFVDLDCKTDRMDLVVPAIVDAGLVDRVFVSTGSLDRALAARAIDPRIRVQIRPDSMEDVLAATAAFDPPPDIYEIPPELVAEAADHIHGQGSKVFCDVFTRDAQHVVVPDASLYLDVYAAGADILQSEFPSLVLEVLDRWRWW